MNFLLSNEQIQIQDAIEAFLKEQSSSEIIHAVYDRDDWDCLPLWQGLMELGAGGIIVPEEYGGLGMEFIDLAIVAEMLGKYAAPTPFLGHSLACQALISNGTEAQKQQWLPKLASGEVIGTIAFAEQSEHWLPEQWRFTTGVESSKHFVPYADVAGLFVVGGEKGSLYLCSTTNALNITSQGTIDRTQPLYTVNFSQATLESMPSQSCADLFDAALILTAADAFGGSSRCIEMAVEYAKLREQFGRPIGQFQGLKHQLTNMAVDAEPQRGLFWFAAHAFDHIPEQKRSSAALAKAHLCDTYLQTGRKAIEAHGGIGYTWEYDIQIFMKRAMLGYSLFGTPDVHRQRYADLCNW